MANKIKINLDTSKELFLNSKCKQNDDLILEANIFENGLAKDLTNCSISIQALKADKTYVIQNTDITKSNNKFVANLVRDFTRIAGKTLIEVVLTESGKQNTTFSFYIEVVGSVIKGAVESNNTVTILENLQDKIEEAGQVKAETEQLIQSGGAATKGDIATVNSQLEHIANEVSKFGADPLVLDNAQFIQKALDKKGIVLINKAGVYNCSQLVIKSNTHLILGDGVTLRLKDGTNNYLLVNEHWKMTDTLYDENITITGGRFDFNKEGNPDWLGNIQVNGFCGCGIVLNHIINFKMENIQKLTGAKKYCVLYANLINSSFNNIVIRNDSDGLHGQPPLKNIEISNIDGITHDNLLPITIGDYTPYTISEVGDVENVTFRNIFGDKTVTQADMIRFVGAGKGDLGRFKNITIENISGNTGNEPIISCFDSDKAGGDVYLNKTFIDNLTIKNIEKTGGNSYVLKLQSDFENLTVDNINFKGELNSQIIYISGKVNNFNFNNSNIILNGTNQSAPIFWVNGTADIKKISLNNFNLEGNVINQFPLFKYESDSSNDCLISINNATLNSDKLCLMEHNKNSNGGDLAINVTNSSMKIDKVFNITGSKITRFNVENSRVNFNSNILTNSSLQTSINNSNVYPDISQSVIPTFAEGWQQHPSLGLYLEKNNGFVILRGMCQTDGISTSSIIGKIPVGHRPLNSIRVGVVYMNRESDYKYEMNELVIDRDSGEISLAKTPSNGVALFSINLNYLYKSY